MTNRSTVHRSAEMLGWMMIGALIALMTATLNLVKAAIEFVSIARKDRAEKKK